MGRIINAYILPHPPIIVECVGVGREKQALATIKAASKVSKEIAKDNPSTIILTSPHAPCFRDYVYISDQKRLKGDMLQFGCQNVKADLENNLELVELILKNAKKSRINAGGIDKGERKQYGISDLLDHGAMVPLYFIQKELANFKLVHISTPFMNLAELYEFGKCIKAAVGQIDEDVVFVASGDMSHRLTIDAPAGYTEKGREYDEYLINILKNGDAKELIDIDEDYMSVAGECGTRSFVIMFGALDGKCKKTDVYSYEGPFGVGYLVAKVNILGEDGNSDVLKEYYESKKIIAEDIKKDEGNHVKLARMALEAYVKGNLKITPPDWLPPEFLNKRAGVFVSLKINNQLRGCIGTISPAKENIAWEIINNAISAGIDDPRFDPVTEFELNELVYSVDVLEPAEKIKSINELDVKRYGVIVSSGFRRGLLLPDIEGIDTPRQQVDIALQKAKIGKYEKYQMERFEVIRYK